MEEEQHGNEHAEYGKQILIELSNKLTKEFGKDISEDNLGNMRRFYLIYQPQISDTVSRKSKKQQVVLRIII